MARNLVKKKGKLQPILDAEHLAYWDEKPLFDLLRKAQHLSDREFKAVTRECLLRLFYGDGDYLSYCRVES